MFTVVVIGRPNVGKSTLFNRLTGTKHAIVHDLPGVTRDRRQGDGSIASLKFNIIDTAGLEESPTSSLAGRMMQQTSLAVDEADVVMMVTDGKTGLLPDDRFFAKWLRKKNKPIVLVVNKCESAKQVRPYLDEFERLGLGEPVCISAEHGQGLADLYNALAPYEKEDSVVAEKDQHIKLAIVGRPNAGKSTLINKLLKTERVLTGPEAGITRDAIAIDWVYKGQNIRLIDTAGIRRKAKVDSKLEKLALEDSVRAITFAQVVVLLIDSQAPLEAQDITIANLVIEEGRALIIAINKWDQVKDKSAYVREIKYKLQGSLPHVKGVPVLYISALTGNKIEQVIDAALEIFPLWDKHISTSALNNWLIRALETHQLPLAPSGRRIRIKYITQGKTRPPTFMLFATYHEHVPDSYVRYLSGSLREEFGLGGVPIRMLLKKSDNPYKS